MSKKKSSETSNTDDNAEVPSNEIAGQPVPGLGAGGSMMEEVQSFLSKRAELSQKLAAEIEAVEKKLAELKKTAALLFPESGSNVAAKDRKVKKAKPKSASREEKGEVETTSEASTSEAA